MIFLCASVMNKGVRDAHNNKNNSRKRGLARLWRAICFFSLTNIQHQQFGLSRGTMNKLLVQCNIYAPVFAQSPSLADMHYVHQHTTYMHLHKCAAELTRALDALYGFTGIM